MKWSEMKKLTPEERRELRRDVAKYSSELGIYLEEVKKIEEENKNQEEKSTESEN